MILVHRPLVLLFSLSALPMLLIAHLLLSSAGRAAAVHFAPLEPHHPLIRSKAIIPHFSALSQTPTELRFQVAGQPSHEKRRLNLPSCKPSGPKTCPHDMVEVTSECGPFSMRHISSTTLQSHPRQTDVVVILPKTLLRSSSTASSPRCYMCLCHSLRRHATSTTPATVKPDIFSLPSLPC